MANTTAYSSCVATADLAGDSEWRLVVAGSDKKMKVWSGTSLVSEHNLLEVPVALCPFYSETQARLSFSFFFIVQLTSSFCSFVHSRSPKLNEFALIPEL